MLTSSGLLERYNRLKEGEALEVLLQEAEAAAEERKGSPKTSNLSTIKKSKSKAKVEAGA
jgi:hypothetical protein